VITGYNSDVRHGSRVYHVQTEDKGLTNPKIETLIYLGGEILDSYRGAYADLLTQPPIQDQAIQARMDDQHKSVIRDIKNGKYDTTPIDPEAAEQRVFNDRPLDQAILEYLAHEGDADTLEMVLDQPIRPVRPMPTASSPPRSTFPPASPAIAPWSSPAPRSSATTKCAPSSQPRGRTGSGLMSGSSPPVASTERPRR